MRARLRKASSPSPIEYYFDGLGFHVGHNVLTTLSGSEIELSSAEGRLLGHFVKRPWTFCTRASSPRFSLAMKSASPERAIDVNVSQLRKKLGSAGIADAERLIRKSRTAATCSRPMCGLLPHDVPARHDHFEATRHAA